MKSKILEKIDQENLRQTELPAFNVGDAVRVHVRVREGDKERLQVFAGNVIARDGGGSTETFTVRRVSFGEGVERVFPLHTPAVAKLEVVQHGHTRRAKLYYLRGSTGKEVRKKLKQS